MYAHQSVANADYIEFIEILNRLSDVGCIQLITKLFVSQDFLYIISNSVSYGKNVVMSILRYNES